MYDPQVGDIVRYVTEIGKIYPKATVVLKKPLPQEGWRLEIGEECKVTEVFTNVDTLIERLDEQFGTNNKAEQFRNDLLKTMPGVRINGIGFAPAACFELVDRAQRKCNCDWTVVLYRGCQCGGC